MHLDDTAVGIRLCKLTLNAVDVGNNIQLLFLCNRRRLKQGLLQFDQRPRCIPILDIDLITISDSYDVLVASILIPLNFSIVNSPGPSILSIPAAVTL